MNKLLFIDDEEGIRRSVVRALKNEPYKTYTAENGEAGISFVKDNIFDIATVVSDYKMPGLNGLETLGSRPQTRGSTVSLPSPLTILNSGPRSTQLMCENG